jgi:glycosyltransferase involved in cell wall biosynthesis
MSILVLTTQRLDDLSGVNTYLRELSMAARLAGRQMKIFSIREISFMKLWQEIGNCSWVHINTADPYSLLLAKLRGKRVLARFHYTTWGTTHTSKWESWGYNKRLWTEICGRWKQFGGFSPGKFFHFAGFMRRLFARMVVSFLADEVSGVSRNLSCSLELPRKIYTVYYPFSMRLVASPAGKRERALLFCGRIDGSKGLIESIHALSVLSSRGIIVPLRVAGDGPERKKAELLAEAFGLSTSITWLGRISGEQVRTEMLSAYAVLVPSMNNDPSPFTVLEAGASRVPVIGSYKGGIPEEIGPGGWIVDPEDKERFADVIEKAWNSPEECQMLGKLLHQHVADRFSPLRSFCTLCALMESKDQATALGAIAHVGRW